MTPDVSQLIEFYRSPLGGLTRRLLRDKLKPLIGDVRGRRVAGIGFATPYLRASLGVAERVVALMPSRQGASRWPRELESNTVQCDLLEMPLTDAAIDLFVAVHAFEFVSDAEELMRELWRVATPGAHLVIAVPRRRGLWAQRDNTPFGAGHPFSRNQLDTLLRDHSFTPEVWCDALFFPPTQSRALLGSAQLFEKGGRLLGPTLAGVTCVKAKREAFPAVARRKRASHLVRVPDLAPQTAMIGPPPRR